MTVKAGRKFEAVERGSTCRNMAFSAGYGGVLPFQWIGRLLMRFHRKEGGFIPVFVVATGALSPVGALCKLVLVGIRCVTVCTSFVRNGAAEIAVAVTFDTGHGRVLAAQRVTSPIVVKRGNHLNRPPSASRVAILAVVSKGPMMRIHMASTALGEGEPSVLDLEVGSLSSPVAFLAGNLAVQAGQRKCRPLMVKATGGFPGRD